MLTCEKRVIAMYVDRTNGRWIVRDNEGNLWIVPVMEAGWEQRQPYELTDDAALEPVPTHYGYLFDLPF